MTPQTDSTLANLEYLPYLDENGSILGSLQGKIGVYAIFDRDRTLQFVGYSRDIFLSFKQHLVRQPQSCYWLKVYTITRPSRQVLEAVRQAWIAENEVTPPGNGEKEDVWTQAIDANQAMTDEEKAQYNQTDELGQIKIRKKIARRVQADIEKQLAARGVNMEIRFNPKIKEKGLLDLK